MRDTGPLWRRRTAISTVRVARNRSQLRQDLPVADRAPMRGRISVMSSWHPLWRYTWCTQARHACTVFARCAGRVTRVCWATGCFAWCGLGGAVSQLWVVEQPGNDRLHTHGTSRCHCARVARPSIRHACHSDDAYILASSITTNNIIRTPSWNVPLCTRGDTIYCQSCNAPAGTTSAHGHMPTAHSGAEYVHHCAAA